MAERRFPRRDRDLPADPAFGRQADPGAGGLDGLRVCQRQRRHRQGDRLRPVRSPALPLARRRLCGSRYLYRHRHRSGRAAEIGRRLQLHRQSLFGTGEAGGGRQEEEEPLGQRRL